MEKARAASAAYHAAFERIVSLAAAAARYGGEEKFRAIEALIKESAGLVQAGAFRLRIALITGWEQALDKCLEDGILSEEEEARLMEFANHFSLSRSDLNTNGAHDRATMSATLRAVLSHELPKVSLDRPVPLNLQKSETTVWIFKDVKYCEERTRREYVGGHHGMSFRVAKGVYYRVGTFRGHPVEHSQLEEVDSGIAAVTTKHIYFSGSRKSFRVPYAKIVSFRPYSDGLGIYRDSALAHQQVFITGEGWFIYNLVVNLAQW